MVHYKMLCPTTGYQNGSVFSVEILLKGFNRIELSNISSFKPDGCL